MVVLLGTAVAPADRRLQLIAAVWVEDLRLSVLVLRRLCSDLDVAVMVDSLSLQLEAVLRWCVTGMGVKHAALIPGVVLVDCRRRTHARVVIVEDITYALSTALVLGEAANLATTSFVIACSVLVQRRNGILSLLETLR